MFNPLCCSRGGEGDCFSAFVSVLWGWERLKTMNLRHSRTWRCGFVAMMAAGFLTMAAGCDRGGFFRLCAEGTPEAIQQAIKKGAKVNARDRHNLTPLVWAAWSNPHPQVCDMLIEAGADVNAPTENGLTALMYAALLNPHPEITRTLLKNGADVGMKDKRGWTALMYASCGSRPEVLKVLLESGADVNAQSSDGQTALMLAADGTTNPEVLETLLLAGAKRDIRDREGHDALWYARHSGTARKKAVPDEKERRLLEERIVTVLQNAQP
jgi:hypothetical protein